MIDTLAERDATYESFVAKLPSDEGRFAVYDFPFSDGTVKHEKLFFIYWCPETLKVSSKVLMSSNKTVVQNKFNCQIKYDADSKQEIEEAELVKVALRNL